MSVCMYIFLFKKPRSWKFFSWSNVSIQNSENKPHTAHLLVSHCVPHHHLNFWISHEGWYKRIWPIWLAKRSLIANVFLSVEKCVYIYGLGAALRLGRKASLCSEVTVGRHSWPVKALKLINCWVLSFKQDSCVGPTRLRNKLRGGRRKRARASLEAVLCNAIFRMQCDKYTHEVTVAMLRGSRSGLSTLHRKQGRDSWCLIPLRSYWQLMASWGGLFIFFSGVATAEFSSTHAQVHNAR